jgi:hypothetical protein
MFAPPSPVKEEKEKVSYVLVGTLSLLLCVNCQVKPTAVRILLFVTKYLIIFPPKKVMVNTLYDSFVVYAYDAIFLSSVSFL